MPALDDPPASFILIVLFAPPSVVLYTSSFPVAAQPVLELTKKTSWTPESVPMPVQVAPESVLLQIRVSFWKSRVLASTMAMELLSGSVLALTGYTMLQLLPAFVVL